MFDKRHLISTFPKVKVDCRSIEKDNLATNIWG